MLWVLVAIASRMKRPQTISVLLPLTLVLFGAVGCENLLGWRDRTDDVTLRRVEDAPDRAVGVQSLDTVGGEQVLTNEEAGIAITLPSSWTDTTGLHNSAELQAVNSDRQLYLIVVAEDATALNRFGLRENASAYRELLADRMQSYEGEFPTDVAFVGNNFANQYEIRGQVDEDTPVVYLHTTVLSEDTYYQVVAWTTPDQYEFYRSELRTIVSSFREIDS
ncbi:hypothetical protein PN498_22130 [Oscillatoria sp. CS-180]|uniref:hypothetical protein n=1 Tax=Oscillatoria sp. CS-180 TaxID=3021720 RepID=UPI00232C8595|nr:hypothetical protein [Oscillatoria sp. CS-180]MDB9528707.1 hypothetical protein [Oscillatoria sp. CS-180]